MHFLAVVASKEEEVGGQRVDGDLLEVLVALADSQRLLQKKLT